MSAIKEIIEQEQQRRQMNELHLFSEGTFWRAYEMSAWLCVRCINEFKVTKRQIKGIENPVCFIGFPQSSTEKWISKNYETKAIDEKHLLVYIPAERMPSDNESALSDMFNIWKDNIEISVPTKQQPKTQADISVPNAEHQAVSSPRLTDIMRDILQYPIEKHTPIECMLFLSDTKKSLSYII